MSAHYYPGKSEEETLRERVAALERRREYVRLDLGRAQSNWERERRTCPLCSHVFRWPQWMRAHLCAPVEEGGHGAVEPTEEDAA